MFEHELTGYEEHCRDQYVMTVADEHNAWHHMNGRWGCPWDCAWSDMDDDSEYGPKWKGVEIESPDFCDDPHLPEPPF